MCNLRIRTKDIRVALTGTMFGRKQARANKFSVFLDRILTILNRSFRKIDTTNAAGSAAGGRTLMVQLHDDCTTKFKLIDGRSTLSAASQGMNVIEAITLRGRLPEHHRYITDR